MYNAFLNTYHDPRLSTHGTSMNTPKIFFLITSSAVVITVISEAIEASKDTVTLPGIVIGFGETSSVLMLRLEPAAD